MENSLQHYTVPYTSFTTQIKLATPHIYPLYLTNLPSSNGSVRRVCIGITPTRRQKLDCPPPSLPKLKPEFIKLSPSIVFKRKYLLLLKELEWILSNQNCPKSQWTVESLANCLQWFHSLRGPLKVKKKFIYPFCPPPLAILAVL